MKSMKYALAGLLGLAGCVALAASAFAVTIGFSQVGDEGDWRPAFSKDMQERAKKEGIDLKFADAQGKEEEQLKAVRAFIAQKVDAIIIAPVVVTGWDQVLEEAKKAGIPVFLADRDVDVERQVAVRDPHLGRLQPRRPSRRRVDRPGEQGPLQRRRGAGHRRRRRPRSSARRASKPSPPTSRTSRSSRRSPATSRLTAARRSWKPSSSRPTT